MPQKILAVDDEPDILRLTQFLLESWGYEVTTASNGKEAIERAHGETPDLILMDVNMEEMNGIEACEVMKSDFATSFIPIIMLTSQDQVHNKIEGLGKGADDYVIKTVDPLELQARIEMVIRRTQEQSGANPLDPASRKPRHRPRDQEASFGRRKLLGLLLRSGQFQGLQRQVRLRSGRPGHQPYRQDPDEGGARVGRERRFPRAHRRRRLRDRDDAHQRRRHLRDGGGAIRRHHRRLLRRGRPEVQRASRWRTARVVSRTSPS